jgi:NitT/TauT family transport system substrate-binding protein
LRPSTMSRSTFVKAGSAAVAAGAVGTAFPIPAIAQQRPVKFTDAFLVGPQAIYLYAGNAKGIFAKHGIDIDISKGTGSLAAAQAIAAGRYDFGNVAAVPLIVMNAKGLPISGISVVSYDAGMGVGVLGDGPITDPKKLAGKRIGVNPASAEVPLFPTYAKLAGIDAKDVNLVNTDPAVLQRLVLEKQLDGMTGIAQSALPLFIAQKTPIRWMLYSSVGLYSYSLTLTTTHDMIAKDPALCQAMADATEEALAWTLVNSEEAMQLFIKAFPELALTPDARQSLTVGRDLIELTIVSPEAKTHGLGYGDPAKLAVMADMTAKDATTGKAPALSTWFDARFGGKVRLSTADWRIVEARTAAYKKYFS